MSTAPRTAEAAAPLSPPRDLLLLAAEAPRALRSAGGVLVAFAAVAMLGLLVMPVTPAVMDVLVGVNISVAATLLLVALFMPDASRFPSFPTILLLTTLYRLALNVSSTRLILGQADAGQIIAAFGNFVVGGNYVVGGVIFLILTVIQFIVIAKGAERVAEVSARFTLDAMQGKQMAIDAELNQGLISPDQARQRRRALDSESRLYGAMDGAMKFVKGDAIAGILISAINILAGLVVGVMQMNMSLADAAGTFTLLTIGDGLVSQIPALLISTAAGLVVTRVASGRDDQPTAAGRDILDQVLAQPTPLICVAVVLLAFAAIPGTGMPAPVFVGIAAVLLVLAVPRALLERAAAQAAAASQAPSDQPATQAQATSGPPAAGCANVRAITLELGGALAERVAAGDDPEAFQRDIISRIAALRSGLGVPVPPRIEIASAFDLPPDGYRVRIFDQIVARAAFDPAHVLLLAPPQHARAHGLEVEPFVTPWDHRLACTAAAEALEAFDEPPVPLVAAKVFLQRHVEAVIADHAAEFLGIPGAQALLDDYEKLMPQLVQEVVPKRVPLPVLADVLERLVSDGIPISDLRRILEALARVGTAQHDAATLAEQIRPLLARTIFNAASGGGETLWCYRLAPQLEARLAQTGLAPGGIDPQLRGQVVEQVAQAVLRRPAEAQVPALLTRAELRPLVRGLLRPTLPRLYVLAETELPSDPHFAVHLLGQIDLPLTPSEPAQ